MTGSTMAADSDRKAAVKKAAGKNAAKKVTNAAADLGRDDAALGELLDVLRRRGELVTTAESLTAGMISARIADIPGASDVLRRAFVTYSDEAKHEMLGVKKKTLRKFTAVSAQTARQMAKGGAKAAGAACCVSATGYAGPAADENDRNVGLVYLGCCYRGKTVVEEHRYSGERHEVRAAAVRDALRLMGECLRENA